MKIFFNLFILILVTLSLSFSFLAWRSTNSNPMPLHSYDATLDQIKELRNTITEIQRLYIKLQKENALVSKSFSSQSNYDLPWLKIAEANVHDKIDNNDALFEKSNHIDNSESAVRVAANNNNSVSDKNQLLKTNQIITTVTPTSDLKVSAIKKGARESVVFKNIPRVTNNKATVFVPKQPAPAVNAKITLAEPLLNRAAPINPSETNDLMELEHNLVGAMIAEGMDYEANQKAELDALKNNVASDVYTNSIARKVPKRVTTQAVDPQDNNVNQNIQDQSNLTRSDILLKKYKEQPKIKKTMSDFFKDDNNQ